MSYKKDKTRDHDEIVLRLKDGRRVVISNNTKVGVRIEPREGDEVNYHGYSVRGTNVIHKVHPNRGSWGGWLEHVKKAGAGDGMNGYMLAAGLIGAGYGVPWLYRNLGLRHNKRTMDYLDYLIDADKKEKKLSVSELKEFLSKQKVKTKYIPRGKDIPEDSVKDFVPVIDDVLPRNAGMVSATFDPNVGPYGTVITNGHVSEASIRHELGHAQDLINGTYVSRPRGIGKVIDSVKALVAPKSTDAYKREERAWDLAGYKTGDKPRDDSLKSYELGIRNDALASGYDKVRLAGDISKLVGVFALIHALRKRASMHKTAQAVDHDKWPGNFQEYQKLHNDKLVWLARKAVIDDRKNRGAWGLATSDGKFLSSDDDVDNEDNLKSVVIRAGKAAREARRASCHELAASILDRLRENRINARRVFVDKDRYNGVAMGHSTVFFQGQDGHWHRAANGIGSRKKSRLGDFTSLEDAIDQYIAVEKANKQTTDDERVDAYDTTDLPFTDNMPWPEYKALARTGKRIYHQGKKGEVRRKSRYEGLMKLAGVNAGVLAYGGGKALEAVGRRVVAPAYRWAAPRIRGHVRNLGKTVPRPEPSWTGDQVYTRALTAARNAEPGPFGKMWYRLRSKDPMKPAVDAAADVYANDAYDAWMSSMYGGSEEAERVLGYLRRQGFDPTNEKVRRIVNLRRSYPQMSQEKQIALQEILEGQRLPRVAGQPRYRRYSVERVLDDIGLKNPFDPDGFSSERTAYLMAGGRNAVTPEKVKAGLSYYARAQASGYTPKEYFADAVRGAKGESLPKGKWFSHDSLMRDLGDQGDFIFKGSPPSQVSLNSTGSDGSLWYSHNPYAAEGYATAVSDESTRLRRPGYFMATPLSEDGAISPAAAERRFTPHTGLSDPSEIAEAALEASRREAAGLKTGRAVGEGPWGDDRHYEIVLRGPENAVAHDKGRHFIVFPGKDPISNTIIARGPTTGHGDTSHFLEVPYEDVVSYMGRHPYPGYKYQRRLVQDGYLDPTSLIDFLTE